MPTKTQNTETAEYIADELIQKSKTPKMANKVFLLVEDTDDRDVFFSKFNKNIVEFRPIKGCGRVTDDSDKFDKIIQILNQNHIKHFAIKDSDFNRVLHISPKFDNLFYTDCHDVEMMCFHCKETIIEIFENFSQNYDASLVKQIFADLEFLSKFKCLNIENDCGYNFKGYAVLDKNGNINKHILSDFTMLENEIQTRSSITNSISLSDIDCFFSNCSIPNLEYEITNGHDFYSVFCCYFRKKSGKRDFCEKHLRPTMCACFRMEHFVKTQLFQNISAWATSNSLGNIFA